MPKRTQEPDTRLAKLLALRQLMGGESIVGNPMQDMTGMAQLMFGAQQSERQGEMSDAQIAQMEHAQQVAELNAKREMALAKLRARKLKTDQKLALAENKRRERAASNEQTEFNLRRRNYETEFLKNQHEQQVASFITPEQNLGLLMLKTLSSPYTLPPKEAMETAMRLLGIDANYQGRSVAQPTTPSGTTALGLPRNPTSEQAVALDGLADIVNLMP